MKLSYIERFNELGLGLFVHFGLYSVIGKGEWHLAAAPNVDRAAYEKRIDSFRVNKNWATALVATAKAAGCKYITITTRHHDGFSLFDTKGLSEYDAPHSACGRDLILEFADACRKAGIVPFFYHTLLDWRHPAYKTDFNAYIDYLVDSVKTLCCNYGTVSGFWFDGMWDKPDADWQEDRLYGTIRKYQPEAMIINNTGLSELGKVGHPEIDSVTFERGKPAFVDQSDKTRAGEMCQVLNDHWGYAKNDCNYKSVKELIQNLVDCRKYGCNFLLNTGLKGNGSVNQTDKCLLTEFGKWIKLNKGFIYRASACSVTAEHATILKGNDRYYALIADVPMGSDPNVALVGFLKRITVHAVVKRARWLDTNKEIAVENNSFMTEPFDYGTSLYMRVAELELE